MDNQLKSASISRHFHYHFHYNIDHNSNEIGEQYSTANSLSPKHNHLITQRLSWKDRIDPEVTRLYQEMRETESVRGASTPRTSIYNHSKRAEGSLILPPYNDQQNNLTQSRMELIQNIQEYQEYLKKRSGSDIFIPNSASFIKFGHTNVLNPQKFMTQQEIRMKSPNSRKSLEQMVRKKTDSKIFYTQKMYESTTARQSNEGYQKTDLIYSKREDFSAQKFQSRSQIKRPQKLSILEKQKITTSHIQRNLDEQNFQEQNKAFSMFRKSVNQESYNQKNQIEYASDHEALNEQNDAYQKSSLFVRPKSQQNSIDKYKYDLVKEQCEFLRGKFIEHIEHIHGLKF